MQLHEMPCNGQAQPETERRPRRGGILLAEALEDVRQEVGRNSTTVVLYDELHRLSVALHVDLHASAVIAELDCIVHEIPQHLLQTDGVGSQLADCRVDR